MGELSLKTVIAAAAIGAFAGDSSTYLVGRTIGPTARERIFGRARAKRALAWAERQLAERGPYLILITRFVPGGRTATTVMAANKIEWLGLKLDLGEGAVGGLLAAVVTALQPSALVSRRRKTHASRGSAPLAHPP